MMISALGAAASGLRDAMARLDVAAHNIANANTGGFQPSRVESVETPGGGVASVVGPAGDRPAADGPSGTDLTTELVSLMVARLFLEANARVFGAASEAQGAIDHLA